MTQGLQGGPCDVMGILPGSFVRDRDEISLRNVPGATAGEVQQEQSDMQSFVCDNRDK